MSGTVLLVEDNADNRTMYTTVLRHGGYAVLHAVDGEECIRMARERHPDLILMDVSIPGLDGYAAARILKADPATAGIPIVALTAHAADDDRARVAEAGCDGFLCKPVEPRRIVEETGQWCTRGGAAPD